MTGKVWKFGRDVNTDYITAGRYAHVRDLDEKVKFIFEDLDPDFAKEFRPGGIIVAGDNFGCGSAREIAPVIIRHAGVAAVVASSFARLFYRNAINIGLPIFEIRDVDKYFEKDDVISIDMESGLVRNESTGRDFQAAVFPPFVQSVIKAGGLVAALSKDI